MVECRGKKGREETEWEHSGQRAEVRRGIRREGSAEGRRSKTDYKNLEKFNLAAAGGAQAEKERQLFFFNWMKNQAVLVPSRPAVRVHSASSGSVPPCASCNFMHGDNFQGKKHSSCIKRFDAGLLQPGSRKNTF